MFFANVLSHWCTVSSLMKFDSSVSNERIDLYRLFKSPGFVVLICDSGYEFCWCLKKHLQIISLNMKFLDICMLKYLPVRCEYITSISVDKLNTFHGQTAVLTTFINSCPQLLTLKLSVDCIETNETILRLSKMTLGKIKHLEIYNCEKMLTDASNHIVQHIINLDTLLFHSVVEFEPDLYVKFFNKCCNIMSLTLRLKSNDCIVYLKTAQRRTLSLFQSADGHLSMYSDFVHQVAEYTHLVLCQISDTRIIFEALLFGARFSNHFQTFSSLTLMSCEINSKDNLLGMVKSLYPNFKHIKIDGDKLFWTFERLSDIYVRKKVCSCILELFNLELLTVMGSLSFVEEHPMVELKLHNCENFDQSIVNKVQ